MKSKIFLLLAVVALSSCVCGSRSECGPKTTDARHVRPFNRIEIKGVCNVRYVQGDTFRVKVEGAGQLVGRLSTRFRDETLLIHAKGAGQMKWWSRSYEPPVVYVTSPDLIGIHMEGAGSFKASGMIDTDTLRVFLKGAGELELPQLVCDEFHVEGRGAGDIEVKGLTARHSSIHLKGVGDVDVHFVHGGTAACMLEGVGDIKLSGRLGRLQKTIRGMGHIDTGHLTLERR